MKQKMFFKGPKNGTRFEIRPLGTELWLCKHLLSPSNLGKTDPDLAKIYDSMNGTHLSSGSNLRVEV